MKAKKFLEDNRTRASCHEIGNAFLTPKATGNKWKNRHTRFYEIFFIKRY